MELRDKCRLNCKQNLEAHADQIFEEYWALGSHDRRVQYVADRVNVMPKRCQRIRLIDESDKKKPRTYSNFYNFVVRGQKVSVCKQCFMAVLNETDRFIRDAIAKKMETLSGVTPEDKRGSAAPANKLSDEVINDIKAHINSYPRYQSHYSRRHTEKYYLSARLTISDMYNAYVSEGGKDVSYSSYYRVFQTLGYKFKEPSLDTCNLCDKLEAEIKFSDGQKQEDARTLKEIHVAAADLAYEMKKADKMKVKADKSGSLVVVAVDLQQCLPTPSLTTSSIFYLRQLWTYNLTIHDFKTSKSVAYMWSEPDGERGADQIATCLYIHVKENITLNVTHIIIWSDQCSGQNKNSHNSAMQMFLLKEHPTLKIVDHKYLVSGHTHLECDIDHSTIEKKKKKWTTPIHHPRDWFTLVRSCGKSGRFSVREMKNQDFLAFSTLLSGPLVATSARPNNVDGDRFLWHDVQWLRYTKGNFGTFQYKCSLGEEEPFKTYDLRRRRGPGKYNSENDVYTIPKCYTGPLPINSKKKEDLLKLLHLIDPLYHTYYQNLDTKEGGEDLDPDIPTSDEEEF
jgi:hypothetical protein